jgi:IMP cyclohydrolase
VQVIAPDKTEEEMAATPGAELIYYKAMADANGIYVASNGAQTEPVLERMQERSLSAAVLLAPTITVGEGPDSKQVELSSFEPDDNHTPRVTGALSIYPTATEFGLSVVRRNPETGKPLRKTYTVPKLSDVPPGVGFGVQTYNGNGTPLPSFDRLPYALPLGENVADTAYSIWEALNPDNRVAVVVRSIELMDEGMEYCIIH